MWKRLKMRDFVLELCKCSGVSVFFSFFFYESLWGLFITWSVGVWMYQKDKRKKREREKELLLAQFRDCIRTVYDSLKTGYSVENAFLESRKDMVKLHGEKAPICRELEWIRGGLVMNRTIEELMEELGRKSGVEQIGEFAQVFSIAKRSGGNVAGVIATTVQVIHRQVEAKEEARTILAARRMEQRIMSLMPFCIVLYVKLGNPGYFDSLYHNLKGILIMSLCMGVYMAAWSLSERILRRLEEGEM